MNRDLKDVLTYDLLQILDDGDWAQLCSWLDDSEFSGLVDGRELMRCLKEECNITDSEYFSDIVLTARDLDPLYRSESQSWDALNHKLTPYIGYYLFSTDKENLIKIGAKEGARRCLDAGNDVAIKIKPEYTGGVDDIYILIE